MQRLGFWGFYHTLIQIMTLQLCFTSLLISSLVSLTQTLESFTLQSDGKSQHTHTLLNFNKPAMHRKKIPNPHTLALPAQLAISPGLANSRRCFQSLAPSAPRLGTIEGRKSAASSSSLSSLRGWPSCVEV